MNQDLEPQLQWRLFRAESLRGLLIVLGGLAIPLVILVVLLWDKQGKPLSGFAAASICGALLWLLTNRVLSSREDKAWLVNLVFCAFLIRVIVSLVIFYALPDPYYLGEDQPGYDHLPNLLVRYWEGLGPRPAAVFSTGGSSRIGYFGFVGLQYYILGSSFLVPRLFNCFAGALLPLYAYRMGTHAFGRNVGKVAALGTAFFPSLILWSSLNLRDMWLALSILIIVWHALVLRERLSIKSIIVILLSLVWIEYTRAYLVPVMVVVAAGTLVFGRSRKIIRDITVFVVFLLVIFVMFYQFDLGKTGTEYVDIERLNAHRQAMARTTTGKSGYLANIDASNPVVLVMFAPLGLAYFLFAPFPWQISGIRQLVTLPEMLAWYACIPFVLMSFWQVVKDRTRKGQALLLPLVIISMAYAITSGNIGTAYRHRAQIIAFYLIFAAAGFVKWQITRTRSKEIFPVKRVASFSSISVTPQNN